MTGFFKDNFPDIKVIWGGPGVSRSLNIDHDIDFNFKENEDKFSEINSISSKLKVKWVLEINGGLAEELGINPGNKIIF